ncbi:hypothetical protein DOTSEDRAFT_174856 [Dothistroma septosporum NZE10]|uniref:SnoaL-like domain-containing protein n=1 Tax=Dothistroma septosporum (strain NZE10 / CBS 128990) TaxID=675120 RepID=N1PI34_DOTSN|nr:hypothetical protein DOTSEDRAFT_174856 [Dothistroma septosporum NZE10]
MSLAEKQIETAKAFVEGYNEFTVEGLLRARSNDCVHAVLPVSLGRPPRTNNDYKMFFGNLQETLKNFKMTIHKIVNDVDQHMAVVHASGSGETPFAHYNNEYAFFLHFSDTGDKVDRIEEFVDSKFSSEFFGKMQDYLKTQQGVNVLDVATAAVAGSAGSIKN